MRPTFLTHTVAAVFALTMMAGEASAVQVTHISWDITGGSFDSIGGFLAIGPITGGSLNWTPPGGTVSTPVTNLAGGTWALILTGPSGYFRKGGALGGGNMNQLFTGYAAGNLIGVPMAASGMNSTTIYPTYGGSLVAGHFEYDQLDPYSNFKSGFVAGTTGYSGYYFTHTYVLGNEVRTYVNPGRWGTSNWGEMLWGGSLSAVPVVNWVGLLALGGLLAGAGAYVTRRRGGGSGAGETR